MPSTPCPSTVFVAKKTSADGDYYWEVICVGLPDLRAETGGMYNRTLNIDVELKAKVLSPARKGYVILGYGTCFLTGTVGTQLFSLVVTDWM